MSKKSEVDKMGENWPTMSTEVYYNDTARYIDNVEKRLDRIEKELKELRKK